MPVEDPVVRNLRAQMGGYARRGNVEAAEQARQDLEVHQLEAHIKRVADSIELSDDQLARLAVLLAVPERPA